ncbi:MAG: hypothetical protein LBP59_01585 [Planctomycetaceae bacterium]|nr:hypothetical protein [Planctomycetaceae bacterium]
MFVLEIQRFNSVKACRPIARQAAINANSSANSLKGSQPFAGGTAAFFLFDD